MKNILAGLLALCLLLCAAGCVGGSSVAAAEPDIITVNATADTEVIPDRVIISIGVSERADTANAVREQGNTAINAVIATMKELGVPEEKIRTGAISIYPNYRYDNYGNETLTGYRFNSTLKITADDVALANKVIDEGISAGGNVLNDIRYEVSDETALYEKTLAQAIEAARAKAGVMATAAGKAVGGVKSITEQNDRYGYAYDTANPDTSAEKASADTAIMVGTQKVTASATVVFYLTDAAPAADAE